MAIFDENDFEEISTKYSTITMQDTINITATTISPLVQTTQNDVLRKRYILIDDVYFNEPFFSANGFRGLLRRLMTKNMVEIIQHKEPNFQLSSEQFYLYSSGSSTDRKSIDNIAWDEIPKVREKAPILSLFGAGLSGISGKCAVSDLKPTHQHKVIKVTQDEDKIENKRILPLSQNQLFFRVDDFSKDTMLKQLVDIDDITNWKKEHTIAVKKSKEKKQSGETEKEKESHISQIIDIESIMPNVTLSNSINPLYGQKFTDIELGLLIKTLLEVSQMQIGSQKRLGYGVLDWHVELYGQIMFSTICDKDYIFNKTITTSKKCKELISIFDNWALKNYNSENLKL